jgi:hypothetical protein
LESIGGPPPVVVTAAGQPESKPDMRTHTTSISIEAKPAETFAYVADAERLPVCAIGFARAIERDAVDRWVVTLASCERMPLRVDADAATGVIDFISSGDSPTEQERDPAEILAEDLFVVAEQRLGAVRDHALSRGHAAHARRVVTKQSCDELHLGANLRHQFQAHDHAGATRNPAGGARFVANRLVTVRQDLPAAAIEKAIPLTLNHGERNVTTSADDQIAHAVAPVQNAQRRAASKAQSREAARNHDRKQTVHADREADGTDSRQRDHRAQLPQSDRLPLERADKRVVSPEQILGERHLVQRP